MTAHIATRAKTQPIGHQSPNDSAFIDLLSTLTVFMTGTLSGLVASNGLKSKAKEGAKDVEA
jgi:hypothetical protein